MLQISGNRKPAVLPEPASSAKKSPACLRTRHQVATGNTDRQTVLLNGCGTLVLAAQDVPQKRFGNVVSRELHDRVRNVVSAHFHADVVILHVTYTQQTNVIKVDSLRHMIGRIEQFILQEAGRRQASMEAQFVCHRTSSSRKGTRRFRIGRQRIPTTRLFVVYRVVRRKVILGRMHASFFAASIRTSQIIFRTRLVSAVVTIIVASSMESRFGTAAIQLPFRQLPMLLSAALLRLLSAEMRWYILA